MLSDKKESRDAYLNAVKLMRGGKFSAAIPILEQKVVLSDFEFADLLLQHARLIVQGNMIASFSYQGRLFKFVRGESNLGLEIHHTKGTFFEIAELEFCKKILPHRCNIVDVGANVGNNLVYYLGVLHPSLVVPVEPVEQAVKTLKKNIELNAMVVDVRGLGLAAGRENGWVQMDVKEATDLVVAKVSQSNNRNHGVRVRCVRIDDLVTERIDFMKIDVEGYEQEVICGCDRILSIDKPILMIESNHDRAADLKTKLSKYNYEHFAGFNRNGYQNMFFRVQ